MTPQKATSGSIIVQGNKNLASEKLQRVRKWSITTYKVSLRETAAVLGSHQSWTAQSAAVLSPPAVHSAGAVGEAWPRLPHRWSGLGAPAGAPQGRSSTLRNHHKARSDAGQSARAVHRYPEDTGRRLQWPQCQNACAARECKYRH